MRFVTPNSRIVKIAIFIVLVCVVLIFAGGVLLGVGGQIATIVLRVLEFAGVVGFPVAGGGVLSWFAYKLLLQPVFRQRKLNRIRELRDRRASLPGEDPWNEVK